jgi:hypothetical protein
MACAGAQTNHSSNRILDCGDLILAKRRAGMGRVLRDTGVKTTLFHPNPFLANPLALVITIGTARVYNTFPLFSHY